MAAQVRLHRVADGTVELNEEEEQSSMMEDARRLNIPIQCYICKRPFVDLHFFYDQLCPSCASLNYRKRNELVEMDGKVALVTGARVKIGFRCALKLLRCGCTVVATSRFAADCARRYAQEKDFDKWKDRLHCVGIDFRDLASVEQFCCHMKEKFSRLDILINNACQTIRRPAQYYRHLLQNERKDVKEQEPAEVEEDVGRVKPVASSADVGPKEEVVGSSCKLSEASNTTVTSKMPSRSTAAEMSQLVVTEEDLNEDPHAFPKNESGASVLDINQQQLDLRRKNSWMLRLEEVSTGEMAEVMAINAIAPAILNARLKSLMEASPDRPRFIVNVSAMEGKFYRYKSDQHPHTNMAKAALNMMTRTSAQDYVKSEIYMTAVDTGWINDEKPMEIAAKHGERHNFQTPLDEVDAAARVLDPVIAPLIELREKKEVNIPHGVFLKDFFKCEW
ncbi:hypothetical protein GUITHDRAFT_70809 [Guillardia theta CCMP2712]|uniref:Oxidoreductase n=2 Tax=Guillardia theta TaxID=55529 RepID=L1JBX3_GUITC|nr:hypothetical protein GUITHDRAFT_70809 [Guillardia theta CCMP2712]EKX46048.1 hypothetical protein GUITHDRAFT_70809 [Guillardia theta CCMP2712]|eukprot:XP_005833028.1 hypothetical protein GUITHDRAFT_70809 [Guillardia theta CCMP2712]